MFNKAGEHVGFAKVTRDTSERRRLEQDRETAVRALAAANEELEMLNRRLQEAADDQSQFLAVTAHELRTPIGVLGGSAEMLSNHWAELEDDERGDLLATMRSSTLRLRRLLQDLLTASRLQSSALEVQKAPVTISDVVADSLATVQSTHPDAQVSFVGDPALTVEGDRDRLAQAVDNLVTNALRHGMSPVTVDTEADDATVTILVSDSGAGVPAAMQPRLFERFATGQGRGGTGLGLFIVRELALAHGGDAFYDPPGPAHPAGRFCVRLPRPGALSEPV